MKMLNRLVILVTLICSYTINAQTVDEIIDNYLNNVSDVFCQISDLDFDVKKYLNGPIKHTTFARLTG